jgi:hypothetical protein
MLELARSVRLAAWGNAVLSGHASPDEAADRVTGDELLRFSGLPGEPAEVTLAFAIGRLRALGGRGLRVVLPVPGDPLGLPGPAAFNGLALDAGEAVLCETAQAPLGLVPAVQRRGSSLIAVCWHTHPVAARPASPLPSLADAEHALQRSLREATAELVALDVARWRPELAAQIAALREPAAADSGLAPGYPARAHRIITLARRVGAIAALACDDHGGAASAGEQARRTAALAPLARASRHAIAAAVNAVLER